MSEQYKEITDHRGAKYRMNLAECVIETLPPGGVEWREFSTVPSPERAREVWDDFCECVVEVG
jgi:hypothetical protein